MSYFLISTNAQVHTTDKGKISSVFGDKLSSLTNFLLHNYCYTNALVNDASLKPFQLQLFTASRFWQDKLRIFPFSFSLKISRIRNKYFLVNLVLGVLRHVEKRSEMSILAYPEQMP